MKKFSKIVAVYCILIGVIGNVLEALYFPQVYLIRGGTAVLLCLWILITIVGIFIEIKKGRFKTEYQYWLGYFILEVSATMVLMGSFSVVLILMNLYPNSYIRLLSFALFIPPVMYASKKCRY